MPPKSRRCCLIFHRSLRLKNIPNLRIYEFLIIFIFQPNPACPYAVTSFFMSNNFTHLNFLHTKMGFPYMLV